MTAPSQPEPNVFPAAEGREVTIPAPHDAYPLDEWETVVGPKCALNVGSWWCLTHKVGFVNNLMKDGHISKPGDHEMAWACAEHGIEVP